MSSRRTQILEGSSRRGRPSAAAAAAAAASRDAPALPPYEPLAHPLNARAQRSLADIANARPETRRYDAHLARCAGYLRANVGAVNDRLAERRSQARSTSTSAARRRDGGDGGDGPPDPSQASVGPAGADLAGLEGEVVAMTARLEEAAREVIDLRAGLEDELAALGAVKGKLDQPAGAAAARQQPGRRRTGQQGEQEDREEGDEDAEMPDVAEEAPIVRTRDLLDGERAERARMYERMTTYDKYCRNNDYIAFRKTLQDATDPDVPVPDPAAWFDDEERPILATTSIKEDPESAAHQRDGEDEDGDELVVTREVVSFICPLTQARLTEPFSNQKCRHTFEKSAILQFIRDNRGKVHCPVGGCNAELTAKDFYVDEVMVRRIKRAERAAAEEDPSSDVDAEEMVRQTQLSR